MAKDTRLVYSTDTGRVRETPATTGPPATDGVVRIQRQTRGRAGKGVSIVTGLGLDAVALKKLARELKQRCGVGGSVKDWNIEIQGDQRETLRFELEKRGFHVKLAGG